MGVCPPRQAAKARLKYCTSTENPDSVLLTALTTLLRFYTTTSEWLCSPAGLNTASDPASIRILVSGIMRNLSLPVCTSCQKVECTGISFILPSHCAVHPPALFSEGTSRKVFTPIQNQKRATFLSLLVFVLMHWTRALEWKCDLFKLTQSKLRCW